MWWSVVPVKYIALNRRREVWKGRAGIKGKIRIEREREGEENNEWKGGTGNDEEMMLESKQASLSKNASLHHSCLLSLFSLFLDSDLWSSQVSIPTSLSLLSVFFSPSLLVLLFMFRNCSQNDEGYLWVSEGREKYDRREERESVMMSWTRERIETLVPFESEEK